LVPNVEHCGAGSYRKFDAKATEEEACPLALPNMNQGQAEGDDFHKQRIVADAVIGF
jgi:hypothetical protein